jgi:hypothetical protein
MTTAPLNTRCFKAPAPSNLTARPSGLRPHGAGHMVLTGIVLCFVAAFASLGYLSAGLFRPITAHPRQSPPVRAVTSRPGLATQRPSTWDVVIDPDPMQLMGTEDEGDGAWTRP